MSVNHINGAEVAKIIDKLKRKGKLIEMGENCPARSVEEHD